MEISYGLLACIVIIAVVAGGWLGAWIVAIFSASQVTRLQKDLDSKFDVLCKDCPHPNRIRDLNDRLADREAYVRSLEERCATLNRSNRQLGLVVQKKSWGKA